MELAAAIHARWAADEALSALLPAGRLTTGLSPGDAPADPYATLSIAGGEAPLYANDGSSVESLTVRFRIAHAVYDQGGPIVDAVLAAFDRSDFALAGGGKVVAMQRTGWPQESQDPAAGRWLWLIEFQCLVQLSSGDWTMTNDFKAELTAQIGWRRTSDTLAEDARLRYARRLTSGTEPGQAEAVWCEQNATLTDGAERTLDLTALERWVFDDATRIALANVRALMIVNHSTGGETLVVGGATAGTWSAPFADAGDRIALRSEGTLLLAAPAEGWPVDSSNRHLRLAASGGTVSYSIALLGTVTAGGSIS